MHSIEISMYYTFLIMYKMKTITEYDRIIDYRELLL